VLNQKNERAKKTLTLSVSMLKWSQKQPELQVRTKPEEQKEAKKETSHKAFEETSWASSFYVLGLVLRPWGRGVTRACRKHVRQRNYLRSVTCGASYYFFKAMTKQNRASIRNRSTMNK
jgi:hypothetical protein